MNQGRRSAEHGREVDVGGRLAADVGDRSGGAEGVGQHVVAQVADELAGHLGLRRGGREDLGRRDGARGAGHRRRHEHDARGVGDGVERRGHRGGRGGVGGLEHQGQRAVHPRAEALGEQVVGLPGGRTGGIVAGVGHGQAHAEDGGGQQEQGAGPGHRGHDRPALHAAGPAVGHRLARRPPGPPAVHAEAVDPSPDHAEERGQQGDGAEHGHEHGGRRAEGEALQEAQPHQQQPEQGDHHGAAGEHHGPPGGAHGLHRGVVGRQAPLQRGAVAGDDEQGVVDAHADADHRRDLGGEVRRRHGGGPQAERRHRGHDAGDRGQDRQAHGHDRPEGDQQDDRRGQQADTLARGHLDVLEQVAAEGDLEPGVLQRLGLLGHRRGRRVGRVVGGQVDGGEGDGAVGGSLLRRVEGRGHRGDAGQRPDLVEVGAHGGRGGRSVEAGGVVEHDGGGVVGQVGHLRAGQVVGLLGVGAGEAAAVGEAAAEGALGGEEADEGDHPEGDHPPSVAEAGGCETFEHGVLLGRDGGSGGTVDGTDDRRRRPSRLPAKGTGGFPYPRTAARPPARGGPGASGQCTAERTAAGPDALPSEASRSQPKQSGGWRRRSGYFSRRSARASMRGVGSSSTPSP